MAEAVPLSAASAGGREAVPSHDRAARAQAAVAASGMLGPGMLGRLEHALYRGLLGFLIRRFRWEAAVARGLGAASASGLGQEEAGRWNAYTVLLERVAGDMAARNPAFLADHPPVRRGHLRVVK